MGFDSIGWIIVMVIAAVVELLTAAMVSVWFVAGAAAAFLLSFFPVPPLGQWLCFALVSLAVLLLFRKKAVQRIQGNHVATNTDSLVGQILTVQETVDNEKETGRIGFRDQEWMARTETAGQIISAGSRAQVLRIEGVRLIVKPAEEQAETHGTDRA